MSTVVDNGYLQKLLQESFSKGRIKNPSYSVRAFAKKLGLSHSAVSEIMNGKRRVGVKVARRLADSLLIEPEDQEKLFVEDKLPNQASKTYFTLQADQYKVVADWSHFAILSLAETKGFKFNTNWIAKRLSLSPQDIEAALQRLSRLGMIEITGGKLKLTGKAFSSPDGIPSSAVRSTHHTLLELAQNSLERDSIDKRDFTAITMAIDPAKLSEARDRIRKFRDELCRDLESGTQKEVYSLNFQLFPLSHEV